jgi:hypothetical protein
VVGRASALLGLTAALVAWFELAPHLGALAVWPSVAVIALVLMPAMFGLTWLALPLWRSGPLPLAAVAVTAVLLAVVLSVLDAQVAANLAKFAAMTTIGWLFLTLFEALSWVVGVAVIIPFVDAYSVWRGPTRAITTHHVGVFTSLSVAFVLPGGAAARLGLPDVMFFAVFLAASDRFGLRPLATWLCMTAALGLTIVLSAVWISSGLPALPAISLGFLAPNADLIWRRLARSGRQTTLEAPGG